MKSNKNLEDEDIRTYTRETENGLIKGTFFLMTGKHVLFY